MENNYYIYFHINPIKDEVFYVGKGTAERAYSKCYRNQYWHNTVNKYGIVIYIVETGLTNEEAIKREIHYITNLGRKDIRTGYLVNMTNGGEGTNGRKPSQESRDKSRQTQLGRKRGPASQETKDKMSKSRKGKPSKLKGLTRSQQNRDNISKGLKGKPKSKEHIENMRKSRLLKKR